MENTGNYVAQGGAPIDKETIIICPDCHSVDVFEIAKTGMCVCKSCWTKDVPMAFFRDKDEYYGEAEAKNY